MGDISVSKQRVNSGAKLDADLEDFFDNGAVGLHIVGADGKILRANKAELEMLGYGVEEYIGRHIADFHADAAVIDEILARLGRGERLDRYPARLRAKDGSIREVLITSSGLFRNGEFIQTRCFTFDVTEARAAEKRLQESEKRFQTMLEALPQPVYTTDAQGNITFYNQAASQIAGYTPEVGNQQWCVSWRLYRPDGSRLPHDECPMAIALKERRSVRGAEILAERPDGTCARLVPYPTPLFDSNGNLTGAINMLVDVTERHNAEAESARLAAIVLSSPDAIISTTLEGTITFWSAGASATYGYGPEEMVGESILKIVPPDLHDDEFRVLERARAGEVIENYETERLTKDGRRVDISLSVSLVRDKAGSAIGIAKVGRDITERRRAERVQNLLMGELNHRVKNTLAIIQAIARQSMSKAERPADFVESFTSRLHALAQAHTILTDTSWQGADFLTLVRGQLQLGRDQDEHISYSGPSVALDPQAALHLALVINELGTNARKYGALSVPTGKLSIEWILRAQDDRSLQVQWKEYDGPAVSAPSRRGFGTTLIEQSIKAQGGQISTDYGPNGMVCEITLPLGHASGFPRGAYMTAAPNVSSPKSSIQNKRILVVEDEPLVAMDLASTLEGEGCEIVGPAGTCDDAMKLIEEGIFDVALLDANLGGYGVESLAAALTNRNIPFSFVTGYGRENLPAAFRDAPLISKPFSQPELVGTLHRLCHERSNLNQFEETKTRPKS